MDTPGHVDFAYEVSFYYVDHSFQYALYAPDPERRWQLERYEPTPDDLDFARRFVEWNTLDHGIQRVDACRTPDGELLLVGGNRNLVFRNNLDGTFTEVAEGMGLAGAAGARDAAFADFDGDGRIDVVVATDDGVDLYGNTSARRFEDVTASRGLPTTGAFGGLVVGDYNNDGAFDLLLTRRGAAAELWRNDGVWQGKRILPKAG